MNFKLRISGVHHEQLKAHLFPGDNLEAVAIALCGRQEIGECVNFLVHEIFPVAYEKCSLRTQDRVTWSTEGISSILQKAMKKKLSVLKMHSHPFGYPQFSSIDDHADHELFESIIGWMDNDYCHVSTVMLPGGEIFGRAVTAELNFENLDSVTVAGNDILVWGGENQRSDDFSVRTKQAFGEGTVNKLKNMTAVVVGCSGTGSPLIEQLVRLGIGKLVIVDPDIVEMKNLNRIYNSTIQDAMAQKYKVDVISNAVNAIGLGTEVISFAKNLYDDVDVLKQIAKSDVIFGCVDSVDGRHLLNQLATFYLIPYFDVGIKLTADGIGGIDQIMGSVHYLQPGGASLLSRGVYSSEDLRAASMLRTDINYYREQQKLGYIVNIRVDSPAVISINTQVASIAVNEFLARVHLFRYDNNIEYAITRISFTDAYVQYQKEDFSDNYLRKFVGRGDMEPFLNMPEF
jgi:hypothetical protein